MDGCARSMPVCGPARRGCPCGRAGNARPHNATSILLARLLDAGNLAAALLGANACRHGGMTELADSDLTEEQEMSLSGHSAPDAKRRYV